MEKQNLKNYETLSLEILKLDVEQGFATSGSNEGFTFQEGSW